MRLPAELKPPYKLSIINRLAKEDPAGFLEACDEAYNEKVRKAADLILENRKQSPIVLLAGPSGSGKTTTAMKIEEELERRGIHTHSISMDNYFKTRGTYEQPLAPDGSPDLESPLCMDMDLLNEHFTRLSEGKRIFIPHFDFSQQMRDTVYSKPLRLRSDEIAIFEGIHAINDDITQVHPEAFKLYVSARANVIDDDGRILFKGTWSRLMRRTVRDYLFRGSDALATIKMWGNVRRGEKAYISPYKDKVNYQFDTLLPYEAPVMNNTALALFAEIPEGVDRYDDLKKIVPALELFQDIDPALVAPDSLLREFFGGGIYEY